MENKEDLYKAVFENTGTGTIIIDENMTILFANATFEIMTGYDRDEIENRMKWSQFVAHEDLGRMQAYHYGRRKPGNKIPTEYECRIIDKSGTLKYIYMKVGMIPESMKSIASFMDITERKRAEHKLQESESKLSAIVEAFDGFIYISSRKKQLEYMNKTLMERAGVKSAAGICHKVIFNLDKPCPWCTDSIAFEGNPVRGEIKNPEDGRWYLTLRTPIKNEDGQVQRVQSILVDITDRKITEEAIAESAQHFKDENRRLRSEIGDRYKFGDIIGKSRVMQDVYEAVIKAAATNAHVIITGESGTGKELVAREIHRISERHSHPFIPVNCGAISETLSESEFFGYKKGAFTGAMADKKGFLDEADGGTLFLDEIGEIGLAMQVKLLRAIEGNGYTPVGGGLVRKPNIRIIAATNRNLKDLVKNGQMREDFYYRVHIIPVRLPPLRERKEDLPLLIDHFFSMFSSKSKGKTHPPIPGTILDAFQRYSWPGNVRELQNAVNRYVTLKIVDLPEIEVSLTQVPVLTAVNPQNSLGMNLVELMDSYEKQLILSALEQTRWQIIKTAEILGIHRKTLFMKMRKFGIK